ncbi:MAG: hypothetical protein H6Q89_1438 [Myxococcaceae bacterium]|nr:hypothetical protein [Myxococcaceae bacterium]
MITLRRAAERGHANHGWLDTHHPFSVADSTVRSSTATRWATTG